MTIWDDVGINDKPLVEAMFSAHYKSAFRPNTSSVTVFNVADSSNDIGKAIAAGILSLGERHGPLEQSYDFLSMDEPWVGARNRKIVPGWGGSFQKDKPDPNWVMVDELLKKNHPDAYNKLRLVTEQLHQSGRVIYPNPSAYTALVGLVLGLSKKLLVYLFIASRLDAWARIALAGTERTQIVWDT